jgi:hypothetical protein
MAFYDPHDREFACVIPEEDDVVAARSAADLAGNLRPQCSELTAESGQSSTMLPQLGDESTCHA